MTPTPLDADAAAEEVHACRHAAIAAERAATAAIAAKDAAYAAYLKALSTFERADAVERIAAQRRSS